MTKHLVGCQWLTTRRTMMRSSQALLAVAIALAMFAGCGSDENGSGSASSGSANGPTVKLGFIGSLSGPVSYPDRLANAEAAVMGYNARGGLLGHKVELVSCD